MKVVTISLKTVERLRKLADDQQVLASRFMSADCARGQGFQKFARSSIATRKLLNAMADELETELKGKSDDLRTEANETPQA